MRLRTKLVSVVAATGVLSAALMVPIAPALAEEYPGDHPFTAAEAALIHQGKIGFDDGSATGLVDLSLLEGAVMDSTADDDFDGIPNANELHVYTKNGRQYLHYLSHPKLKDTDGDGLKDKEDSDPLSWNVHARDGVIYQELSYRNDAYQLQVLGQNALDGKQSVEEAYAKSMVDLPDGGPTDNSAFYKLMRREVAPFWNAVKTWHTGSGFDATMYEFSNKTFPYLKDKSTHVLGIRGTTPKEDPKDLVMDGVLAMGQWMGQDDDAWNLARELYGQQDRFKNITVAGHSLGGYLSQMFFVASLGGKYGNQSENGIADYNWWDKGKVYNPEVKHVYGFNAPRITHNWFNMRLREYYWLGKYLDEKFENDYFQVNNDPLITVRPDRVHLIGNSPSGHRSRAFWENRFSGVPGFSVGERNDLSGLGYQEPALKSVRFIHPTVVKVQENGSTLAEVLLPKTQDEIAAIDKAALAGQIDPAIIVDSNPVQLKYGEINTLQGHIKKVNVTYKFVLDGSPVATKVVQAKYKTDYTAPELPQSTDQDYEYVAQVSPLPKVPAAELTEDKELIVTLLKEPVIVSTKVLFKDGTKVVKSLTKESKPSQGNPTLVAADYPEGYELPNPLPALTAGTDNEIAVIKKQFTLTYRYVDADNGNAVVGTPATETVKYGEDGQYQLDIPTGYQLANGYSFTVPANVKADTTVEIKIQAKHADSWQLKILYKHNDREVGSQVGTVKTGDKVALQLPTHSDPNKTYVLKQATDDPYTVAGTPPSSGEEEVEIKLQESIAATPINQDTVIHFYNITLNYVYAGNTVKTDLKQHLRVGSPITVEIPTSTAGTYTLAPGANIPTKVSGNQTITVPLQFTPNKYQVNLRYIYTKEGNSQVLAVETQQVEHGQQPTLKEHIDGESAGRYYQLQAGYQAPTITEAKSIDVPMDYIVKTYNVTVKYMENGTQIGADDVQQVKDGEKVTLNLPTVSDYDGQYILDEGFTNPIITADQVLKVPLKRQINSYSVTINYQFNGQNKANSLQMVESGKTATNDYGAVIEAADDSAVKTELRGYIVDPTFAWNQPITAAITLNVPLLKKATVPAQPAVNDPCGANNATWVKPADTAAINWEISTDGHLLAKVNAGYAFDLANVPAGVTLKDHNQVADYGVAADSGVGCPSVLVAPPTINGVRDQSIAYGATFNPLAGVHATDGDGSDLTAAITVTGQVDTSTPGVYQLTYHVTNASGGSYSVGANITVEPQPNTGIPGSFVLRMVQGMGQKWIYATGNGATFKSNGTFDPAVVKVLVDGSEIAKTNYTAAAGSVIVTLKPEYLNTLAVGKHTLGIVSKEGTASTDFYILEKPAPAPVVPPTKDTLAVTGTQSVVLAALGALLAVVGVLLCWRRKNAD